MLARVLALISFASREPLECVYRGGSLRLLLRRARRAWTAGALVDALFRENSLLHFADAI